jgi:hypothetical protein
MVLDQELETPLELERPGFEAGVRPGEKAARSQRDSPSPCL